MNGRRFVWPAILAGGGFILGLVLLCIAPFAAVATVAARTLPLRVAIVTAGVMWLGGQIAGFAFYHYPHELATYALGLATLIAAIAATIAAARVKLLPLAFLLAFAVFELVQFAFASILGGSDTFTVAIVADIFEGNLLGLAILWALRLLSGAAGLAPATSPVTAPARRR